MRAVRCCFLSVVVVSAFPAFSQTMIAASVAPAAPIRMYAQVTSDGSHPVSGLRQSDFTVLDNRVGAKILSVKEQSPATEPAHMIIVVDSVNVRYSELAYERDQIVKFLRTNDGKLAVPTDIAILTDKGMEIQKGFTQDGNALAKVFDEHGIAFRTITRAAGFWGATDRFAISATGLDNLCTYAATLPGRKFVLWASPGWPMLSGPQVDLNGKEEGKLFGNIVRLSNEMRNAGVTLYSMNALGATENLLRSNYYKAFTKGVARPKDAQLGNLALQVLAEQSGGLALEGSTDLTGMMMRCLQDASSWYQVQFASAEPVAEKPYHHIDMHVDKPGLTVRTRDAYYAEQ